MDLLGTSIIGFGRGAKDGGVLHGMNAATGERLEPPYFSASDRELDHAVEMAADAFPSYRALSRQARGGFLRQIAANLEIAGGSAVSVASCRNRPCPKGAYAANAIARACS